MSAEAAAPPTAVARGRACEGEPNAPSNRRCWRSAPSSGWRRSSCSSAASSPPTSRCEAKPATWPPADVELETALTAIATVLLIASSGTIHLAGLAQERDDRAAMQRWLLLTFVLGALFLANVVREFLDPRLRGVVERVRLDVLPDDRLPRRSTCSAGLALMLIALAVATGPAAACATATGGEVARVLLALRRRGVDPAVPHDLRHPVSARRCAPGDGTGARPGGARRLPRARARRPCRAGAGPPARRPTARPGRGPAGPRALPHGLRRRATASTPSAPTVAPDLRGVGAAAADFQLSTGRMPDTDPDRQPESEAAGLLDAPRSTTSSPTSRRSATGPPIPDVHEPPGDLQEGGAPLPPDLRGVPQRGRERRRAQPRATTRRRCTAPPRCRSPRPSAPARPTCRCSGPTRSPTSR